MDIVYVDEDNYMRIDGNGTRTYLYVNGIKPSKRILLHDNVVLAPVKTTFQYEITHGLFENDIDFATAIICGSSITAQLYIKDNNAKELAIAAWNSTWDCILLSAIFHCEVNANIQCDKPVEQIAKANNMSITNYYYHGIFNTPYLLTSDDEKWIKAHYSKAYDYLENVSFRNAIHAMASYKWHSMPQVQLAILWAGIESLFNVANEISFRISLYIANFLSDKDIGKAKELFNKTRTLYNTRSSAVHGNKMKGNIVEYVSESAILLNQIIRKCIETNTLPVLKDLVFPDVIVCERE